MGRQGEGRREKMEAAREKRKVGGKEGDGGTRKERRRGRKWREGRAGRGMK